MNLKPTLVTAAAALTLSLTSIAYQSNIAEASVIQVPIIIAAPEFDPVISDPSSLALVPRHIVCKRKGYPCLTAPS